MIWSDLLIATWILLKNLSSWPGINRAASVKLPEDAAHAQQAFIDYLAEWQQWLLVVDNLKVN